MHLSHLLPARLRNFSNRAIDTVTSTSRTTRWRDPAWNKSRRGADVVDYMHHLRAEAGLPALKEEDILLALVAIEDAIRSVEQVAA